VTNDHPRFPEVVTAINAIGAVITAAVLSQIEMLRFGTFLQMLGAFLVGDAVLYAAMKLGLLRRRSNANRN